MAKCNKCTNDTAIEHSTGCLYEHFLSYTGAKHSAIICQAYFDGRNAPHEEYEAYMSEHPELAKTINGQLVWDLDTIEQFAYSFGRYFLRSIDITMRDYLAVHAPDVPRDFDRKTIKRTKRTGIDKWEICDEPETDYERVIRWRWFYANEMIAER